MLLPRTTPSEAGVAASGIAAFVDAMEAAPQIQLHSLMVLRRGEVLAEAWWAPYEPDGIHLLYSLSKSFTSTACGLAVAEGRLNLDDPAISFFPEYDDVAEHPWSRQITVRDLAAMATGHRLDTLERARQLGGDRLVRGFFAIPPDAEPGSLFCYNNGATFTLAALLQKITGEHLSDYLRPRLFEPLGIGRVYWDQWTDEGELGFSGLYAATDAVARLVELYRCGGVWHGEQLLSAEWVAEATRVQTPNPDEPNPDWQQGYGFQFWMARHGYRGDGAYGQFGIVLPDQEAVVAITAETEDMQAVLDAAWETLLPAFDGPGSSDDDAALSAQLSELRLPLFDPTAARPEDPLRSGDAWVQAVDVSDDAEGWILTLVDAGRRFEVPVGDGEWRRTEVPAEDGRTLPVVAVGGWSDSTTFAAELIMVETAHRIVVSFAPASGESHATWHSVPLRRNSLLGLATR